MTAVLDERAFNQRKDALLSLLEHVGEVRLDDLGTDDPVRVLRVSAHAPLDPPYDLAFFKYEEIYARRPQAAWVLVDYRYEFQQRPPPGRRSHHLHDPWGYHRHCCDPAHADRDDHYVGEAIDVYDAHREFLFWFAGTAPVHCIGLQPLFT